MSLESQLNVLQHQLQQNSREFDDLAAKNSREYEENLQQMSREFEAKVKEKIREHEAMSQAKDVDLIEVGV